MDIEKTIKSLTTDEKIRLLGGDGDWHTYSCNGKIPVVMMTDGPHGIRKLENEKVGDIETSLPATCFPTASAVACSWNPEVLKKMGEAIAREAKSYKISMVLGCGINIKRSPLCGRNFEYLSEDPFLTGRLAKNYIDGVQSLGVGTSLKHFALNSQETRRMTENSLADERTMREIYLSAFEYVVKNAHPTSVMASYNQINGEFGARNKYLLTDILKNEWGYEGAVISDWGAVNNVTECFKSGLTLEMPDPHGFHTRVLKKAYEKGEITDAELDLWVKNVLTKIVSLYENVEENYQADFDSQNEIAREIEDESAVLLKNTGVLPVSHEKQVIIVGELAKKMRFQGGGSSHINAFKTKNAIDAIKEKGYSVKYVKGYDNNRTEISDKEISDTISEIKKDFIKDNTVILYFIGLTDKFEGEGYDRTTLDIPENELLLLKNISREFGSENIACISFGGAPMDFSFDEYAGAVLHMYLGGQAVGEAVADLISGHVNPSGKLAETIPYKLTDTPAYRYFGHDTDTVEYMEAIFVGYRYYETYDVPVKYPFGYGLSYTKFEYSDLEAENEYKSGKLTVKFKIKNVGTVPGAEIAEVYVNPKEIGFIRSKTELKGFKKVYLKPGEEKEVEIELDERSFSVFDISKKRFSVIEGMYDICVSASVKDTRLTAAVHVIGEKYGINEKELYPDYFNPQPHGMDIDFNVWKRLYGKEISGKEKKRGEFTVYDSYKDVVKMSLFGKAVNGIINAGLKVMLKGKEKDDPAYLMVKKGVEEGCLEGLIATSGGIASAKLIDMLVLNANKKYLKAFFRMFHK